MRRDTLDRAPYDRVEAVARRRGRVHATPPGCAACRRRVDRGCADTRRRLLEGGPAVHAGSRSLTRARGRRRAPLVGRAVLLRLGPPTIRSGGGVSSADTGSWAGCSCAFRAGRSRSPSSVATVRSCGRGSSGSSRVSPPAPGDPAGRGRSTRRCRRGCMQRRPPYFARLLGATCEGRRLRRERRGRERAPTGVGRA